MLHIVATAIIFTAHTAAIDVYSVATFPCWLGCKSEHVYEFSVSSLGMFLDGEITCYIYNLL